MKYSAKDIQERIQKFLPEGKVITRHSNLGHFYEVIDPTHMETETEQQFPIYPSVTGKLQILKDESLINYKKNQVIQYVFRNFSKLNEANLMEKLGEAERVPEDILADASDIGTQIHDTRERIFTSWMQTGVRPADFLSFIEAAVDVRVRSAIRALEKFCREREYLPIATELFVYDHKLKVAGTLDDLGVMPVVIRPGDPECEHDYFMRGRNKVCFACDRKVKDEFVLMDLKSSNQFKLHYWFQVALYWHMFNGVVGIKPQRCLILKLSKEDGTYKLEELRQIPKLVSYAKAMIKTNEGMEFIKEFRKDNQKKVAPKIEF